MYLEVILFFVHVVLSFGPQDGADGSVLADNLFELNNGCICCTVKDDLVTTLETLLERRNKFDYVIIETTGLANPVRAHPSILHYVVRLPPLSFSLSLPPERFREPTIFARSLV